MRTTLLLLLVSGFVALAADSPRIEITQANVASFYRAFTKLFKQPRYVPPALSLLCGVPSPEVVAKSRERNGPHSEARIHVYVSATAFRAIDQGKFPFAVGSVVVKEKLGGRDSVVGIGGMIKREPEFDSENGDWEYFYSDLKEGFKIGKLQNCSRCHAKAKATDFVFSKAEPQNTPQESTR